MALAPARPGVRSLVIRGKAAAEDSVAVLTLARPSGRRPLRLRLAREQDHSQDALSRSDNGGSRVLPTPFDSRKI